jgi:prepilin-type N-terminal cleavage/methylation domain-containing protein
MSLVHNDYINLFNHALRIRIYNTYMELKKNSYNSGFSLVELSIVLVILGLLTGGILTGQSLIKAAELRSITTEVSEFQTAINTFKGKYFALPGDMTNATSFWGDNGAECADAGITDGTPGTCNGDGDGIVEETAGGADDDGESYMFWNQLAYAGMINGEYSGVSFNSNDGVDIGVNTPASAFNGATYQIVNRDETGGGSSVSYAYDYENVFLFGTNNLPGSDWAGTPVMTPEEAWNIDTKMDDGKPARGNFIARYFNDACAAADDGTNHDTDNFDASYKLSDSTVQCGFYIRNMY